MDNKAILVYRVKKYLKILLIALLFLLLGLLIYEYIRVKPNDVHFTNVTSSSVTVSWTTKSPMEGFAVVVDERNNIPIKVFPSKESLAFDTREPMSSNGTWGDPENGFIGSVNGSIFNRTGFGVYEKPILNLALEYYNAAILEDADLTEVLNEVLSGNPVIVWGLLSRRASVSWQTKDGKVVSVRPGEHARVVIGFTGDPLNPKEIILMDPIYGRIRMGKNKFISDWEIMDNRAVVVYKDMTISNQI